MSNQRWSKYYEKNKEAVVARTKAWRAKNPERTRQHQKDRYARARIKVLSWYAKGIPKCACCGETELQFLALDHINGKSREKRKECGINFYLQVRREGYVRNDLQVLCHNCNMAKGFYGKCPHRN